MNLDLELQVFCSECGEDLTPESQASWTATRGSYSDPTLKVEAQPCPVCTQAEKEESYKEGIEEGKNIILDEDP